MSHRIKHVPTSIREKIVTEGEEANPPCKRSTAETICELAIDKNFIENAQCNKRYKDDNSQTIEMVDSPFA